MEFKRINFSKCFKKCTCTVSDYCRFWWVVLWAAPWVSCSSWSPTGGEWENPPAFPALKVLCAFWSPLLLCWCLVTVWVTVCGKRWSDQTWRGTALPLSCFGPPYGPNYGLGCTQSQFFSLVAGIYWDQRNSSSVQFPCSCCIQVEEPHLGMIKF